MAGEEEKHILKTMIFFSLNNDLVLNQTTPNMSYDPL